MINRERIINNFIEMVKIYSPSKKEGKFANYLIETLKDLGGEIIKRGNLLTLIKERVVKLLNNYVQNDKILKNIDEYIVLPKLKDDSALLGALALCFKK